MLNTMRSITSRQNPIVRAFRELAASPPHDGSRLLLDGAHLVQEARAARLPFEQVAVAAHGVDNGDEVAELARVLMSDGVDVVTVTEPVMSAMSPVRTPSGIVAIVARTPTPPADICQHPAAFVVAPVDVQDPGNLGALLRASEAGGATGAVVCGRSAQPFSWKAVRGSMGSILRLPVASGVQPEALLSCARKFGLRSVASVARGGRRADAIDWRGRVLLFVGGEGPGLADDVIAACDERVTIPMQPPVESLNVAVAGALLVYEARRQRMAPGTVVPIT
jgi:TrmH family RNA methyltransferase